MSEHNLLLETYIYDPTTGYFTRLKNRPHAPLGTNTKGAKDKWGYLLLSFNGKVYKAHRLAWLYMTGNWPNKDIDHKNRDKADNRWNNLRLATETQNLGNSKIRTDNTSGIKGVSKKRNRWAARIQINRETINLGVFLTKEEASMAYKDAAIKYFGEFASG